MYVAVLLDGGRSQVCYEAGFHTSWRIKKLGSSWAVENLFRPRTEGTNFRAYTDAIRELLDA